MDARTFIDSNSFLYATEELPVHKSGRASEWLRHLLRTGQGVANLQVMNEIANVLLKRGNAPPEEVFSIIDGYKHFGASVLSIETVAAARLLHFETGYSWWDCILLASAMELQCRYFLSEDLQDNRQVRGLTIINPFRHSPPQSPVH